MKPGDFLINVLDLFAILLPGSLATWLVCQYISQDVLARSLTFGSAHNGSDPNSTVVLASVLIASYTLGHFVFMLGSRLDPVYNTWRERVKPKRADKTFNAARDLHRQLAASIEGGEFTTLKWARTYVQIKAPAARAEIDRIEADSKFFRSLVVVSAAFAAHFLIGRNLPVPGLIAIGFGVLSFHRYREQRWKMTELTYATAVMLYETNSSNTGTPAARNSLLWIDG